MITVFLAALAASVFGTTAHQTELSSLPIGLTLAFAAVAISALEARRHKLGRVLFPLVFSLFVFLFAQNLTGDMLIPNNDLGVVWSYGSVSIGFFVSLWPNLILGRDRKF